jgi:hypothetical protein
MDDLTGKINELLSDPDSMEKIKNLAGMFAGSSGGDTGGENSQSNDEKGKKNSADELPFDPEMLLKIKSALDIMKKDDPRIDFLLALKPNLSDPRSKKVDEAIHILRLLSMAPMLREQGLFNF